MREPFSFTNLFVSQIWRALTQYKKLPHTFIYLFAFFLLADVRIISHSFSYLLILTSHRKGLNTTGTLVTICQNDKFHFSFLYNTYLGLSQAVTSTIRYLKFLSFLLPGWINIYNSLQVRYAIGTYKGIGRLARRKWLVSCFKLIEGIFLHVYIVRHDKCRNYSHPSLGHDWYLDNKVWVCRSFERDTLVYWYHRLVFTMSGSSGKST